MTLPRFSLQRFIKNVISFIHLQLFITLISMPILLAWGMPISLLTFAGNFLFSPILTAFLLLSSLIFFCEILCIPNSFLVWALEHLTHWWLWLMKWAGHGSLVAFALPSLPLLIFIPLAALAILHHKKLTTPGISIACYSGLIAVLVCYLLVIPSKPIIDAIECNNGSIHIIHHNNERIIVDPGYIGRRLSAPSWCEYTLMPLLAKKYGATTIDHMIILQPNRIIFDALMHLLEKMHIKNIYIPYWQEDMPPHWLRSFMQLKQSCSTHSCTLIRLGNKPCTVGACITISQLENMIHTQEFFYPAFHVTGMIDNQSISFYSAKHNHNSKKGAAHEEKNIDDHST